jgi:hypothetical protein
MESEKQVNFYFSGLKDSGLVNETDSKAALKFIILQNDQFHTRNTELTTELAQSKAEMDELDDLNSKLDRQKAVLTGHLKNAYSLLKPYRELAKLYQRRQKITRDSECLQRWSYSLGLGPVVASLMAFSIWSVIFMALLSGGLFGYFWYYWLCTNSEKIVAVDAAVKDLLKEIEEVEKANTLLDQLIEGL